MIGGLQALQATLLQLILATVEPGGGTGDDPPAGAMRPVYGRGLERPCSKHDHEGRSAQ